MRVVLILLPLTVSGLGNLISGEGEGAAGGGESPLMVSRSFSVELKSRESVTATSWVHSKILISKTFIAAYRQYYLSIRDMENSKYGSASSITSLSPGTAIKHCSFSEIEN